MTAPAKILVVDDTPANVKLLTDLLMVKGYQVVTAASGEEALARVAAERPDLVLLDVVMPGIDGWQMLQRMQERHGSIPVIMFSGKVDEADVAARGAQGFIGKPFDPTQLIESTKQLLPR
jgi:twitching motility two-component system response regulator PilH